MANSVALSFAVVTSQIPATIIEEASKRYHDRFKQEFNGYLRKKYSQMNNVILETLPSVNGLPISAYLNRMCGVVPFFRHGNTTVEKSIEDNLNKLVDAEATQGTGPKVSIFEKVQAVRKLCRLAVDPQDCISFSRWLANNAARLNEALANAVATDHRELTQEGCFTIAYLARQFRFQMYEKLDQVVASLVKAMATAFIPWEYYVEHYREAKERHNDMELSKGRPMMFHFPRMEYLFHEVNHRLLGCIYYTLGDLFFSCPSPKLIHFFECRIFRRKEMTRNMLFTILYALVSNMSELQTEAERLMELDKQALGPNATAPTGRRARHFSESTWNELPANLYSDIIRVYNDRNRANKLLINEIMALLRAQAPEKLPMFEEAALKALEMYAGGGSGGATRTTEPYQIGRNAMGRDNAEVSSQRRHKSFDIIGAKVSGQGAIAGLIDDMHAVEQVDSGEQDADDDEDGYEDSTSESSNDSFTTGQDQDEKGISRRTVIGPKIVDLLQPNQFYQK